ncbi:MAG: nucleotidyltransferase domain-containing protein [Anaerolineales bacterium]|nr:nucleotidyltransferase domain-containing protein [Anaerolineales bacterium]
MNLEHLSLRDSKVINQLITQLLTDFPNSLTQITLFGSKARGDDTEESDIDMLIITKNEVGDLKAQIRDVGYDLSLEYDVIFNLFPYTQDRWNWMASIRHPLWRSITAEGIDLTPDLSPT